MADLTYLFIDGAYLRDVYKKLIPSFFGVEGKPDLMAVMRGVGANRVFYYDCLHDVQLTGESDKDYQQRVASQRSEFDDIQSLPGIHLRLGSLSGRPPKLRQKKVDVLLAVEALDHAFRRNMNTACLIAGDLDFAPLVDSLVRLGVYVRVFYEKGSAARELYAAADMGQPITLSTAYRWTSAAFQAVHKLPFQLGNTQAPNGCSLVSRGQLDGEDVQLWRGNEFYLFMPTHRGGNSLQVSFPDRAKLEQFFESEYGHVVWVEG